VPDLAATFIPEIDAIRIDIPGQGHALHHPPDPRPGRSRLATAVKVALATREPAPRAATEKGPTMTIAPLPPTALDERVKFAQLLAKASLLPGRVPGQARRTSCWPSRYADALGLSPMAAIQGIHVIDGKPTASAQLISALVPTRRAPPPQPP